MASLTLVRGVPGSGKSTIARRLAQHPESVHLEADMFFMVDGEYRYDRDRIGDAHQWCMQETMHALLAGKDVVVSNTFTTKKELRPYFNMARNAGIQPNVILAQGNFDNIHNVPADVLRRMRERFEHDITDLYL